MKKALYFLPIPILILAFWGFTNYGNAKTPKKFEFKFSLADTTLLKPEQIHTQKALVVAGIISYNHYTKKKLDDDISKAMFDAYIEALDDDKLYFLASDIQKFEVFRDELDDLIQQGNVEIAYNIYNVYKQRILERIEKILKDIDAQADDFSKDEYLDTESKNRTWAKIDSELDEEWRKQIKNQILALKISGKKMEESKDILKKRYITYRKNIQQIKSEDVFQMFMNCLTESYDPHTNYFSPVSSQNFNMRLSRSFEGIGARLQTDGEFTVINEVMAGGPAFKDKELKKDDKIIAVGQGNSGDFTDVVGWRIDDVVSLIRGDKGTTVRLKVIPANSGADAPTKVIKLVRDKIKLEEESATKKVISVNQNAKIYKIGIITVPSFYLDFKAMQAGEKDYKSTSNDVRKLLEELKAEKIDGVVIDLRNNGGGSLKEAIDLTGLFIKEGAVVQVRNGNGSIDVGKDKDASVSYAGPLAVMVNNFSASASEIFAGAIQDYKRGIILGEQTFGKGTVQSPIDLAEYVKADEGTQGQLNLTLSKYYRITGSSTQNLGVKPDVEFPSAFDRKEVSEASERSALPWDEIKATNFDKTNDISKEKIEKLQKSFQKYLKTDVELKDWVNTIEEMKILRKKTKISLQESQRKKELEEYEAKQAKREKVETSKEEEKDVYLKNGINLLTELITVK